jgi:hypothetical protein
MAKTVHKMRTRTNKTPMILHEMPKAGYKGLQTKTITTVVKSNSKYDPKFCQAMIDFFSTPLYTADKDGKSVGNILPTFIRFALSIKVTDRTLDNWVRDFPEFAEAYRICKALQKDFIIQNGLLANYSAPFSIFTAKNITDMRDDQPAAPGGGNTVNNYFLTLEGANDSRLEQIITEGNLSLNSGSHAEAEPKPSE